MNALVPVSEEGRVKLREAAWSRKRHRYADVRMGKPVELEARHLS